MAFDRVLVATVVLALGSCLQYSSASCSCGCAPRSDETLGYVQSYGVSGDASSDSSDDTSYRAAAEYSESDSSAESEASVRASNPWANIPSNAQYIERPVEDSACCVANEIRVPDERAPAIGIFSHPKVTAQCLSYDVQVPVERPAPVYGAKYGVRLEVPIISRPRTYLEKHPYEIQVPRPRANCFKLSPQSVTIAVPVQEKINNVRYHSAYEVETPIEQPCPYKLTNLKAHVDRIYVPQEESCLPPNNGPAYVAPVQYVAVPAPAGCVSPVSLLGRDSPAYASYSGLGNNAEANPSFSGSYSQDGSAEASSSYSGSETRYVTQGESGESGVPLHRKRRALLAELTPRKGDKEGDVELHNDEGGETKENNENCEGKGIEIDRLKRQAVEKLKSELQGDEVQVDKEKKSEQDEVVRDISGESDEGGEDNNSKESSEGSTVEQENSLEPVHHVEGDDDKGLDLGALTKRMCNSQAMRRSNFRKYGGSSRGQRGQSRIEQCGGRAADPPSSGCTAQGMPRAAYTGMGDDSPAPGGCTCSLPSGPTRFRLNTYEDRTSDPFANGCSCMRQSQPSSGCGQTRAEGVPSSSGQSRVGSQCDTPQRTPPTSSSSGIDNQAAPQCGQTRSSCDQPRSFSSCDSTTRSLPSTSGFDRTRSMPACDQTRSLSIPSTCSQTRSSSSCPRCEQDRAIPSYNPVRSQPDPIDCADQPRASCGSQQTSPRNCGCSQNRASPCTLQALPRSSNSDNCNSRSFGRSSLDSDQQQQGCGCATCRARTMQTGFRSSDGQGCTSSQNQNRASAPSCGCSQSRASTPSSGNDSNRPCNSPAPSGQGRDVDAPWTGCPCGAQSREACTCGQGGRALQNDPCPNSSNCQDRNVGSPCTSQSRAGNPQDSHLILTPFYIPENEVKSVLSDKNGCSCMGNSQGLGRSSPSDTPRIVKQPGGSSSSCSRGNNRNFRITGSGGSSRPPSNSPNTGGSDCSDDYDDYGDDDCMTGDDNSDDQDRSGDRCLCHIRRSGHHDGARIVQREHTKHTNNFRCGTVLVHNCRSGLSILRRSGQDCQCDSARGSPRDSTPTTCGTQVALSRDALPDTPISPSQCGGQTRFSDPASPTCQCIGQGMSNSRDFLMSQCGGQSRLSDPVSMYNQCDSPISSTRDDPPACQCGARSSDPVNAPQTGNQCGQERSNPSSANMNDCDNSPRDAPFPSPTCMCPICGKSLSDGHVDHICSTLQEQRSRVDDPCTCQDPSSTRTDSPTCQDPPTSARNSCQQPTTRSQPYPYSRSDPRPCESEIPRSSAPCDSTGSMLSRSWVQDRIGQIDGVSSGCACG